jgi:D-amino-acid dehydrogenase
MSERVVVIGGGIIGLSCAYELLLAGFDPVVLDAGDGRSGTSFGNAGMIVPSHVEPLANPGTLRNGLRWMLRRDSPFRIQPRFSPDLIRWLLRFRAACSSKRVDEGAAALARLSIQSRQRFETWQDVLPDFGFRTDGLLMLVSTEAAEISERHAADLANRHGVKTQFLDAKTMRAKEPRLSEAVRCATFYPGDATLNPATLMKVLQDVLKGRIHHRTPVLGVSRTGQQISSVRTISGSFRADRFVLAAGLESSQVARMMGFRLCLQSGKGYTFDCPLPSNSIRTPAILMEPRVSVTPMDGFVRFGGTLELGSMLAPVDEQRFQSIVHGARQFYNDLTIEASSKPWVGFRPCSPDGLPYLGFPDNAKNVFVAAGHAMLGVSLAAATGQVAAQAFLGSDRSELLPFSPDR